MPKKVTKVKWSASELPWGVSFNEATGTFSGIPEDFGEYIVPVTVQTNYGKDSKNVLMNVKNPYWVKRLYPKISNIQTKAYGGSKLFYADKFSYLDGSPGVIFPVVINSSLRVGLIDSVEGDYFHWNMSGGYSYTTTYTYFFRDYCYCKAASVFVLKDSSDAAYPKTIVYKNPWLSGLSYIQNSSVYGKWMAADYSPELGYGLFVSSQHEVVKLTQSGVNYSINGSIYSPDVGTVYEACLRWSGEKGIFCLTGSKGTASSPDGETWELNTENAPEDLIELFWNADTGKFMAISKSERIIYASEDGLMWEKAHTTPVPELGGAVIKRMAYSEKLKKYCVAPNYGTSVYFSTDLETWTASKVSAEKLDLICDVIYAPSLNNWILVGTNSLSLSYFYTLEE